jgi:NADH-quinone oxidoreductase subunit N
MHREEALTVSIDVSLLLPVIIPGTASVFVLMCAAFFPSRALALALSTTSLAAGAFFTRSWNTNIPLFSGMLHIDPFAQIGALFCFVISGVAMLAAPSYFKRMNLDFGEEYYALILAATAGMTIMVAANDLMVLFINLELVSIATYIMCGMNRNSAKSTESALKYFVNGAAAAAFMLFGIALVFGVTGSTDMAFIAAQIHSGSAGFQTPLFPLGLIFIAIGFFFKLGLFPFHAWLPDVYEGAPTPTTGFMAAAIRTASGIALIRIVVDLFEPGMRGFSPIIWWIAVITMTIGNIGALRQDNVKRMLGYSSVAHAGYLLIGFVALSSAKLLGAEAILYYLLSYSLMSLGIFIFVGQVEGSDESNLGFDAYRGLGLRQPFVGLLASILLLSLTGIPPLAGFWGKFSLFSAALHNGFIGLAVIGALTSVVSAYYYFRLMVSMYMQAPAQESKRVSYAGAPLATCALALCAFLMVWLGIGPVSLTGVIPSVNILWVSIGNGVSVLMR